LSGGWRRLADIARATLHAPSLLILDEPTVGLDPEHRAALWAFLEKLRRDQGTAVLFSTHYLAEAEGADEVVLLDAGKVVERGAPSMLMQPFGVALLEAEGPGVDELVAALETRGLTTLVVRTPAGCRIGLATQRDRALELAGSLPGINRALLRRPTLEDVYFARTDAGNRMEQT
jgi:ABC-type multidrug transport system ATPase subunit